MRILLIEDDPMIGNSLAKALRDLGMSVDWVTDGLDGEEALAADEHTLVLLNLGCRENRASSFSRHSNRGKPRANHHHHGPRRAGRPCSQPRSGRRRLPRQAVAVRELVARMNAVLRRQSG